MSEDTCRIYCYLSSHKDPDEHCTDGDDDDDADDDDDEVRFMIHHSQAYLKSAPQAFEHPPFPSPRLHPKL